MILIEDKFVKVWTNFRNVMKILKVVKNNFDLFNKNF